MKRLTRCVLAAVTVTGAVGTTSPGTETRIVYLSGTGMDYTVPWDGRDDKGNPVASGVYFYRLRAAGQQFTKKMVLIR